MKKLGLIIVIAITVILLVGYGIIENRNKKREDIERLAIYLLSDVQDYSGEDEKMLKEWFINNTYELLNGILMDKGLYYLAKEGKVEIPAADRALSIYMAALEFDDMCSFFRSQNSGGVGYDDFCVNVMTAVELMKQKINGDNSIFFKKKVLWFYY